MSNTDPPNDSRGVLIDRDCFERIDFAIRVVLGITYIDQPTANAGLQNIVVWGGPGEGSAIILIAGES